MAFLPSKRDGRFSKGSTGFFSKLTLHTNKTLKTWDLCIYHILMRQNFPNVIVLHFHFIFVGNISFIYTAVANCFANF